MFPPTFSTPWLTVPSGDDTAHENFVQVSEAYDVLSDSETRQVYDRFGHEGVQNKRNGGNGGGHDPFDIFSRFFGGHGHSGRGGGEPRGHNVEVKIEISLRDFYNGATTEFQWNKQHICEACEGTGSADGQVHTCDACSGRGVRIQKQMIMPGMFQQMQVRCDACGGRGKIIQHKCATCQGERVERKATAVNLKVERGAAKGSRVVYENEADESPDWVAGDLLVTLLEKTPSPEDNSDRLDGVFFRRKDDDLYWTELLSLREAWMGGWTRNITHLDAHTVRLGRKRGEVVQPGHVETIPGEGMPRWHEDGDSVYHTHEFGNLYVEYAVVLPDQMESGMEDEFWSLWEKYRAKKGVDLHADSGRPEEPHVRDEL